MNLNFPKVLIFNAPPRSGKDLSAEYCCKFVDAEHKRFKTPLLKMCAAILKVEFNDFLKNYNSKKDFKGTIHINNSFTWNSEAFNISMREFMIHISENVMKPIFGDMFFGLEAGKNLNESKWNIFSDGGFEEEIIGLLTHTCMENIIVVKIQRDGRNFSNDSRGWIDDSLVGKTVYMENNGTIEEWYLKLDELIEKELR